MAWTSDDLLSDVRRSAMLPAQASTGTADGDILAQADKEMQTRLMPLLISVREEFYVRSTNYATYAGKSDYRLSKRNLAGRVRDVIWLSQGNVMNGSVASLARLEPQDLWKFASNLQRGEPAFFYVESASIVLAPIPSGATGVLQVKWYTRPGRMVPANTTTARSITSVIPNGGGSSPSVTRINVSGAQAFGSNVDLVRGSTPFEYLAMDVPVLATGANYVDILASNLPSTFTGDVDLDPTGNSTGDWVAAPDTSPVIQLPVELHGVLAQRVVARMLHSLGFLDEASAADKDADRAQHEALKLLAPRVEGEPRKVVGSLFWRKRPLPGRY